MTRVVLDQDGHCKLWVVEEAVAPCLDDNVVSVMLRTSACGDVDDKEPLW